MLCVGLYRLTQLVSLDLFNIEYRVIQQKNSIKIVPAVVHVEMQMGNDYSV